MVPSGQLLPGLDAGYRSTYTSHDGVIRPRTEWIKIVAVDHQTGVVEGNLKTTGDAVKVSMDLIHTISSPYEHL